MSISKSDPATEPADEGRLQELREQFEQMICELLTDGRRKAGYALADLAVGEGLWPDRWQRPIYLHPTTERPSFFDTSSMWFVEHLERNWSRIREEVDRVTDPESAGFSSAGVDGTSVHGTGWRQLMLWDRGRRFDEACERFPVTAEVVSAIPEATTDGTGFVMLSWLHPGTWLAPHCGPSNAKARTHLAVRAAPGARIRVGQQERVWEDGRAFAFDDSYEHEVWHEGDQARVVLIVDTPHPFLLDPAGVVGQYQSSRANEVQSFMESMGLTRIERTSSGVSIEFDDAMMEFMRSYLTTREIQKAELSDGVLTLR